MALGKAARLRQLLMGSEMVIAPGAYDAITARMIEQAGFPAVYMTGAGTAAALGYPDFGLVTMTEMVATATRIAHSIQLPLIADADTGYGNELNVVRTVQEHERAGTAGIHIEDQVSPKKCGHLEDKEIVPREEFAAKIRAAVSARVDPDFLIIARTDSRAVAGLDEAVTRCKIALDCGADMVFLEAPQTLDEVAAVPGMVGGPCMLNVVFGGKTPQINLLDAQSMGYKLAIVPGLLSKSVVGICDIVLAELKRTHIHPIPPGAPTVKQSFNRFGAEQWDALRTRFRTPASTESE
jgi:2-methylisocitrate lyase-like PEP mutase family enzyme